MEWNMARKSYTPKTMRLIEIWGWAYWRVESFNSFTNMKTDLFNIIDFLAITPFSTIGVQACGSDFAGHITKLCIEERTRTVTWLSAPHRKLILIGWRKVLRKRGGKMRIYKPRVAHIYLSKDQKRIIFEEKETDWYGQ